MIDKWRQICHSIHETGFHQLCLKHSTLYVLPLRKSRVLIKAGSVDDGIIRDAVLFKDHDCGISLHAADKNRFSLINKPLTLAF